ncbi:sodium-coupled neutral amino acid transporter 9 homolog [Cylas formicarius]|uniref:sodium-coupled neutral amino acid transporter 9 homolog n=1 Tax=Cylas formicarius TaxID=197179 RepID=UPI0029589878|nr:sodium-coupled neutral amino acid transporter 9 homolog [Cylas formicarius]
MRDLIRNYRNILAGKNSSSDSDTESQPLVSSSYTSTSSYGSTFSPSIPSTDTEEEIVQTVQTKQPTTSGKTPLSLRKNYERRLILGPSFEPPELDIFTSRDTVFDSQSNYAKLFGLIDGPTSFQMSTKDPNVLKSSSTTSSYPFSDYRDEEKSTQNSIVTIFAIWNTTMGSSLLAMSWGIQMAGLVPGIIVNILVAAICLYTCYLLLTVFERHGMPGEDTDISHICLMLLGRWAEILAKVFSIVVLLGANIVYMILMSNFLYNSVYFLHELVVSPEYDAEVNQSVLCPKQNATEAELAIRSSVFDNVWDLYGTVPLYLAVILFTVLNFKSPTFFAKFNCLGTISVMYLLTFVAVKAFGWGINIPDWHSILYIKPTFPALSGMLSLSYFIHNIIVSIMKTNKHQHHNGRDLSIAFGLITFTYLFIGVLFYISFPLDKSCIEDNIFNNFTKRDTLTIVARILLMFQLFTVFPLIAFMLRNDVLRNINDIFKNYGWGDFSYGKVAVLNGVVLFICVVFACALPKIGTLIRYTGAMSGMVYIFMLPNLLKMASLRKGGELTSIKAFWHVTIIVLGSLNLLSQFFISD